MSQPKTAIAVISPNRWFRQSFGKYAQVAYANAEIHEQEDYTFEVGQASLYRLVVVDANGASSGVIHRLPGLCLEQAESLAEQKWVAVIPYVNDELTDSLLFAGYNGIIVKAVPPQTIVHSFEMLAKGEVVRPTPSNSAATNIIPESIVVLLSEPELELYRLMLKGSSIASIARELSISEKECVDSARGIMSRIRGVGVSS